MCNYWSGDWRWTLLFLCYHGILTLQVRYFWLIKWRETLSSIRLPIHLVYEILSEAQRAWNVFIEEIRASNNDILQSKYLPFCHLNLFRALISIKIDEWWRLIHLVVDLGVRTLLHLASMNGVLRALTDVLGHQHPSNGYWFIWGICIRINSCCGKRSFPLWDQDLFIIHVSLIIHSAIEETQSEFFITIW